MGLISNILKGGQGLLTRAEYLEFEYHSKVSWADQTLKQAIDMLDAIATGHDALNHGIWMVKIVSWIIMNPIACVNPNLAPELADIMEVTFHKTLLRGKFKQSSKVKWDPFQI